VAGIGTGSTPIMLMIKRQLFFEFSKSLSFNWELVHWSHQSLDVILVLPGMTV